ncbi:hypothetical protein [Microbispora sp. H10830]|uniref:hypothetical protein n=1 Tax=Microbispora sp. H10830 TaxID=2729109 RepID=UPI00160326A7|nr:hypothetical protein [Microbispora sp. H10830]
MTQGPGQQLVPLALKPGQLPARGLRAGDRVLVAAELTDPGQETRAVVKDLPAVVDRVGEADPDGVRVVDLLVGLVAGSSRVRPWAATSPSSSPPGGTPRDRARFRRVVVALLPVRLARTGRRCSGVRRAAVVWPGGGRMALIAVASPGGAPGVTTVWPPRSLGPTRCCSPNATPPVAACCRATSPGGSHTGPPRSRKIPNGTVPPEMTAIQVTEIPEPSEPYE